MSAIRAGCGFALASAVLLSVAGCAGLGIERQTFPACGDGPTAYGAPRAVGGGFALPVPTVVRPSGAEASDGSRTLAGLLGERKEPDRFSIEARDHGSYAPGDSGGSGMDLQLVTLRSWERVPPRPSIEPGAPCVAAPASVEVTSDFSADAVKSVVLEPDLIGAMVHLRANRPNARRFVTSAATGSARKWAFFDRYPFVEGEAERLVVGSVDFYTRVVSLGPDAPATACVVFSGTRGKDRVDGFLCPTGRGELGPEDVGPLLDRVRIEGLI